MYTKAWLPQYLEKEKIANNILTNLIVVVFGIALLVASSYITLPLPFTPVPLSLQTLAVLLIGSAYGVHRGTTTLLLYLILGMVGLPFFADGKSGIEVLSGATGGYLVGFMVAATFMGYISEKKSYDTRFMSAWILFFVGHTIIFTCGVAWLSIFVRIKKAVWLGFVPFIPGEIVKTTMAAILLPKIWKLVR
ncbi:MAG: biotin transporter BioY [Bdellovibrionales bacterium]|nr:biotin transporter BioY [Bdellovibrionales bacterium]